MDAAALIEFRCNICDTTNACHLSQLSREVASCTGCGSTVRMRSVVQVLSTELFGKSLRISEFGSHPEIAGIGMSCWTEYASRFAQHLGFTNTYYHTEPRLDITDVPEAMNGTLDFVTSSDVFEHVAPPVSKGFANVRRMLKPDGVFIFSVPHNGGERKHLPTREHFPALHRYEILDDGVRKVLRNTTATGEIQTFEDLVFHGGEGATLEMRVFSQHSALNELAAAGFNDVTIYSEPDLEHGIYWSNRNSLTMAARTRTGIMRRLMPNQRVRFR